MCSILSVWKHNFLFCQVPVAMAAQPIPPTAEAPHVLERQSAFQVRFLSWVECNLCYERHADKNSCSIGPKTVSGLYIDIEANI